MAHRNNTARRDGYLDRCYKQINMECFDNMLPKFHEIELGINYGMKSTRGICGVRNSVYNGERPYYVHLNGRFAGINDNTDPYIYCEFILVLIHEMVHLYFFVKNMGSVTHGKEFTFRLRKAYADFDMYIPKNGPYRKRWNSLKMAELSRYDSMRKTEFYRYTFQCTECGMVFKRQRTCKIVEIAMNGGKLNHRCRYGMYRATTFEAITASTPWTPPKSEPKNDPNSVELDNGTKIELDFS